MKEMRRRIAPEGSSAVRLPFVEGLRGVAALVVVLGHVCSMADPSAMARKSNAPEWLQRAMAPFIHHTGHLAVAAFIVISGFCLQLSLFGRRDGRLGNLRRFFGRRARRILPAYYVCLALSIVVALTVTQRYDGVMPFDQYLPVTGENVVAHAFLVHNLMPEWMYKINGVLWSIAVEAQLYLLFPLLVGLLFRFGRKGLLLSCAAVAVAAFPFAPKLYSWFLFLFASGMVAAHLSYRPLLRGTRAGVAYGAAFLALGAWVLLARAGSENAAQEVAFGLAVACLLYANTVAPDGRFDRALSWGPLVTLGGFSYSLYLMHHPIQQVVYALKPAWVRGEGPVLAYLLLVGLPIILVGTRLFALVLERPFLAPGIPSRAPRATDPWVPTSLPLKTTAGKTTATERKPQATGLRAQGVYSPSLSPQP